eukprot:TRINITY_DN8223_c0_g1_i4.p1 TRINITY_DN8223_c0_g1~~TRINITY_DN8223_c0_g1_i4.p1  ORF type:complete len:121 (+),score=12.17 TRINITY_DN8223_c0_g1_i4:195-557(+)
MRFILVASRLGPQWNLPKLHKMGDHFYPAPNCVLCKIHIVEVRSKVPAVILLPNSIKVDNYSLHGLASLHQTQQTHPPSSYEFQFAPRHHVKELDRPHAIGAVSYGEHIFDGVLREWDCC